MSILLLSRWFVALVSIGFGLPATVFSQVSERPKAFDADSQPNSISSKEIAAAPNDCPDKHDSCCRTLSQPFAMQKWQAILDAAVKCKNSDEFNVCNRLSREAYISYLSVWIEKLKPYSTSEDLDPLEKLEIKKEIRSIEGRIDSISSIKKSDCIQASCNDCADITCRNICKENRRKMIKWRSLYKDTVQGNQYLKCGECLQDLETYYNEQKKLYLANKLTAERMYTKQHIEIMWGLLFCVAQSSDEQCENGRSCLDKAQDILPHAMLPFVMPPAELIQLIGESFRKKGRMLQAEIETIIARKQESIYLIKELVQLLKNNDRVPDIPPADLASVLLNLLEHNSEALKAMVTKDRLTVFNETFRAIDEEDIKKYQENSEQNKAAIAKFIVLVIKNADKDTLEMLESVGFTNNDLRNLIVALYKKTGQTEKKAFIDMLRKIFHEDTMVFNQIIAEEFLHMGNDKQKSILEDGRYETQIKRLISNLEEVHPGGPGASERSAMKNKYIKSFLMPGYPISHWETDTSKWVEAWNYSNYALLGMSLVAQMLFINSDYEQDAYYQAGVVGTYLFALNGLAGVIHAKAYRPPEKRKNYTNANLGLIYTDERFGLLYRICF